MRCSLAGSAYLHHRGCVIARHIQDTCDESARQMHSTTENGFKLVVVDVAAQSIYYFSSPARFFARLLADGLSAGFVAASAAAALC